MEDENENVEEEEFSRPPFACDEQKKDMFLRVRLFIRGLTTSTEVQFNGIVPKLVKRPANASVEVTFDTNSLCVTVRGESGDLKWKKYQLKVEELPYEIVPEESYHQVAKNLVILYLHKKEDLSWYPALFEGLDSAKLEISDIESSDED